MSSRPRQNHIAGFESPSPITAADIRETAESWFAAKVPGVVIGNPAHDDRRKFWRVPLLAANNREEVVGELRVRNGDVTSVSSIETIAQRCENVHPDKKQGRRGDGIKFRQVESRALLGDAGEVLADIHPDTAQLVFTSPPYFNAKPEYHDAIGYSDYLNMLRGVFTECHRVLSEGRFLVVNTSPILVPRVHRGASSRRIPLTYDVHGVLDAIGFDFIDDIVWEKPEGAGWHLGRGRRFAADRQPLQYKAVTVTENVTVYRKRTDRLIDWNIRNHPDPSAVECSLIDDDYERTNIWRIAPTSRPDHPAVFPMALAERVVRYYSFVGDLVLDPFAGVGTTGRAAATLGRRYLLVEKHPAYYETMIRELAEPHQTRMIK